MKGIKMFQKIKGSILVIVSMLTLIVPVAMPLATAYAGSDNSANGCNGSGGVADQVASGASQAASQGANGITCSTSTTVQSSSVGTLAATIVNIFSIIVGAAAIIMIIYAGFRYITSGGSTDRIGSAKTTLIYAIIGLVVVALAQLLVHFVLGASINQANNLTQ